MITLAQTPAKFVRASVAKLLVRGAIDCTPLFILLVETSTIDNPAEELQHFFHAFKTNEPAAYELRAKQMITARDDLLDDYETAFAYYERTASHLGDLTLRGWVEIQLRKQGLL